MCQDVKACRLLLQSERCLSKGTRIACRKTYEETALKGWQVGDCIKMFWAEKGSRGHGQWFEGTVAGLVERNRGDPYRASPWATVSVQWGDSHNDGEYHENFISPWELTPARDDAR